MPKVELKKLNYHEWPGKPGDWSLDGLVLGQINLLVGKNATGKSRVLNVIGGLSRLLSTDRLNIGHGNYVADFVADGHEINYVLRIDDSKVLEERVLFDGQPKLTRTESTLELWYEKEGKSITHEPSHTEISAAARKDKLQHPFLVLLNDWAKSVRHYRFGGDKLGQNTFGIKVEGKTELDDKDPEQVVPIFLKGQKDYGLEYVQAVINDMKALDFPVSEIDTGPPQGFKVLGPLPLSQMKAITVKEDGVEGLLNQTELSQGMFRSLSVLAQVNYSQFSGRAHCVLVDDIGEGLDFERAALLIDVLRQKAKSSQLQLIMATNDKFVMNKVPLDEWSVLQRSGGKVAVRNIHNSKAAFEDFRYVGLSNFAFFEMDFASGAPSEDRNLILEGMEEDE